MPNGDSPTMGDLAWNASGEAKRIGETALYTARLAYAAARGLTTLTACERAVIAAVGKAIEEHNAATIGTWQYGQGPSNEAVLRHIDRLAEHPEWLWRDPSLPPP